MKKIIIILIAAMSSMYVSAQVAHEFSVYGSGGFSTLSYQLSHGDKLGGGGGDVGLGYTLFISNELVSETGKILHKHWGVYSGLGLGLYNAKAELKNVKTVTGKLNDGEPTYSEFDMRTTLDRYKETQKTLFLNIPVMAVFQYEQLYFMGGFKFGVPIGGKFESKGTELTNIAYYPDLEVELNKQTFRGLGKLQNSSDGKLKQKVTVMLALETGWNFRINSNFFLYTGVYLDCGLNNIFKSNKEQFITYDSKSAKDFSTNSVLYSYQDGKELSAFTEKVRVMAVGVKLRLAYIN